jgi:hypothetical protein
VTLPSYATHHNEEWGFKTQTFWILLKKFAVEACYKVSFRMAKAGKLHAI